MKYLLILLFLVGCSKTELQKDYDKFEEFEITRQEAENYIGKCYHHWSGYIMRIERNTENIHKIMRDGTVNFCGISKECDFRDNNKCILAKNCGQTVSKEAIVFVLNRENYKKEPVDCPK